MHGSAPDARVDARVTDSHAGEIEIDDPVDYEPPTIPITKREGHELARAIVAAEPDDLEFRAYFDRCQPGAKYSDNPDDLRYVVDWFYVPWDRITPKDAFRCLGRGGGMCGPGSRGQWYIRLETRRPAVQSGEQLSLLGA